MYSQITSYTAATWNQRWQWIIRTAAHFVTRLGWVQKERWMVSKYVKKLYENVVITHLL